MFIGSGYRSISYDVRMHPALFNAATSSGIQFDVSIVFSELVTMLLPVAPGAFFESLSFQHDVCGPWYHSVLRLA